MRALLRTLWVALVMLLLSTNSLLAQIEPPVAEEPKPGEPADPGCPTIHVEPAMHICPGWEQSTACLKTAVNVTIHNTTECVINDLRIIPMPHSQGVNFSVCAPGYPTSRHGCAPDLMHVGFHDQVVKPGDAITFQLTADQAADFSVEMICPETHNFCRLPVHVALYPSPYPQTGTPDPNQPLIPTEPVRPAPVLPGENNGGVIPAPMEEAPHKKTGSGGYLIEGGGSGTGTIGGE